MNKGRFEAFSDGVFAFAITLLALGFVLPHMHAPSNREVAFALLRLWPNLITYGLSFSVIGLMWQNHHALFRLVRHVDRRTVFWNMFLLGATVLVPFATTTLGSYPTFSASTFLYGLVLSTNATFFNLILLHLVRSDAFEPEVDPAAIAATVRGYRIGMGGLRGGDVDRARPADRKFRAVPVDRGLFRRAARRRLRQPLNRAPLVMGT